MFKMGDEANGLELQAISGLNTIADIRATVGAALGEEVISATVDRDTFAGFGFPGAADLANMFELFSCPDWERYIKAEYEKVGAARLPPPPPPHPPPPPPPPPTPCIHTPIFVPPL